MAHFSFVASDNSGALKNGEMEAIDRESAIDFLKSENLLVISVKEKATVKKRILFGKKLTYVDKINFTENLSTMLKAGVSINKGLDVLANESKNGRYKSILTDIKFSIENGKSFSESLSAFPEDFNEVFINMIRSGEASGKMDESLKSLATGLKKEYSLISKVKTALIYPFVLIGGVVGVMILIIIFVIPKLANIFAGTGYKIPFTTRILFFLSSVSSKNPILTISILILLIIIAVLLFRLKKVRSLLNQFLFKLPFSASLLRQIELVRFCRTTGELLTSGITIGKALEISADGMGSPTYKKLILTAKEKILKGISLANAFRGNEKYFPGLLISVISVGEKTGDLGKLLLSLADFYEEQTDNILKSFASLVEPVLLVIVGLLIGGMAISIVVPIYQLIGTI